MTIIFCDEAGNSGQNLFDAEQPFFILASNDYALDEASELIEHVASSQGAEPKFTRLRKTKSGVQRLIRFLADPRLNEHRVVVDVFHKEYMVITKLVDLVAETLTHKMGEDLYKRGANIGMANMLYYCLPVFCGGDVSNRFLQTFVKLIRDRTEADIQEYLKAGRELKQACKDAEFSEILFPFTTPEVFPIWFNSIGRNALDPAIPALFEHINAWGMRKADRFCVMHDQSKPILASEANFRAMMATTEEQSQSIGYDRRKFKFPLRAISLEQGDSSLNLQLQVADICAGAINHFLKHKVAATCDELADAIEQLGCPRWVINGLVPSTDVTPEELGTDQEDGTNPIEPITTYLASKKKNN